MKLTNMPPPPKNLPKIEAGYWKEIGDILVKRGTLDSGDLPAFGHLCGALADVDRARHDLVTQGGALPTRNGQSTKGNPAGRQLDTAKGSALQWLGHFGLTPASRNRAAPAAPAKAHDPLESFGV